MYSFHAIINQVSSIAELVKKINVYDNYLYELKESDGKCVIMQYLFVIIA